MAPGVQLKCTLGCSQMSIASPAIQMRRGSVSAYIVVSSRGPERRSGRRSHAERVEVEVRTAEVAAEPHDSGVHQVHDGRDDLGFACPGVGNGLHQIEQRELERHGPCPSFQTKGVRTEGTMFAGRPGSRPARNGRSAYPFHPDCDSAVFWLTARVAWPYREP